MSFPVINSKLWTRTDQYKIRITITKLLAGYPAANRPDPDIRPPDNPAGYPAGYPVRDTSSTLLKYLSTLLKYFYLSTNPTLILKNCWTAKS